MGGVVDGGKVAGSVEVQVRVGRRGEVRDEVRGIVSARSESGVAAEVRREVCGEV